MARYGFLGGVVVTILVIFILVVGAAFVWSIIGGPRM